MRRLRGALGTGATWAVAWAAAGIGIGLSSFLPWHPFGPFMTVMDAPLPALGVPGFVAGIFFSIVLRVAGRGRTFQSLSITRIAAWGAVGGALLVLFPFFLAVIGLASAEGLSHRAWDVVAAIAPVFVLLSAASAAGSLVLARRGEAHAEGQLPLSDLDACSDVRTLGEAEPDLTARADAAQRPLRRPV